MQNECNISIHALREEGDAASSSTTQTITISIHALREEGDGQLAHNDHISVGISIHALREEGDLSTPEGLQSIQEFLSTPSARRATGYV